MSKNKILHDEIIRLGGDEGDYEMLLNVDDDHETIEDYGTDSQPLEADEVRNFIKSLGFEAIDKEKFQVIKDDDVAKEDEDITPEPEIDKSEKPTTTNESKSKKKKNKFKLQDDEITSTTEAAVVGNRSSPEESHNLNLDFTKNYQSKSNTIVKLTGRWFEQFNNDPSEFVSLDATTFTTLRDYATKLMYDECSNYRAREEKRGGDAKWMRTVIKTGTLGDKVAAHTLMVQNSPVHALPSIDALLSMLKAKSKREPLLVIDPLKELWLELLPNRKLKTFDQHPFSQLQELSSGNNDTRDRRLIIWLFEEQLKERYSQFVSVLQGLLQDQLAKLKSCVLAVVQALLVAKPEQEALLLSLLVNKLGDPVSKTASIATSLLIKLVEQHPVMKAIVVAEVERMLYRPNIAERSQYYGICFLNQIRLSRSDGNVASKLISIYFTFFKEFAKRKESESKILAALLTGVNRAYSYANLTSEAMQEEMETLYKTAATANFTTAIQALMLLQHAIDSSSGICDRFYTALYRKVLDPELAESSKQALFLNLLYKSLTKDGSVSRVKAFVKRLLQVCLNMKVPFLCGTLVLISELVSQRRGLLTLQCEASLGSAFLEESDDEELYVDADGEKSAKSAENEKTNVPKGWVHRRKVKLLSYDPQYRNPLGCHADHECMWELRKLACHFHPTVAMYADTLLKGKFLKSKGDPLQDFTLIKFLDRFVFRNPKTSDRVTTFARRAQHGKAETTAINSEQFYGLPENMVPVHERFFHRYFKEHARRHGRKDNDEEIGSDVSDGEFDDFLDSYESKLEGKDFAFDFAGELERQQRIKKAKRRRGDASDDESDDDDVASELDLSDEEPDFGDDQAAIRRAFGMSDSEDEGETEMGGYDVEQGGGEFEVADEDDMSNVGLDGEEDDGGWESDISGDMDVETDEEGEEVTQEMDEFDEDQLAFSEEEDAGMMTLGDLQGKPTFGGSKKRKINEKSSGAKKKKGANSEQLHNAAEELSTVYDENTGDRFNIGSQAVSNKDRASTKQLSWEADRDRWMTGSGHWKGKKGKTKGGFKKPSFQKKKYFKTQKGNKKKR